MPPATKRRKIEPTAVEEITFDLTARHEYLTGFHKRKVQRAKQAQEAAEKRAKAEKVEHRKQIREERKADLERHVREVNALLAPATAALDNGDDEGSESAWSGIEDLEPPPIDHEAEYIDEDKYTTVTVEAMDVSRDGLFKAEQEDAKGDEEGSADRPAELTTEQKRKWTKDKPKDGAHKVKKKKRNFRYESKAERKATRSKERSKNHKQARERKSG
ncbi:hypothetical protein LTR84_003364 [Exophiala bonariae]|uniref:Ribosomal RNA-processing protein 17 n=1 Tax=Exophiala bonariae TaxID=1690606 RepID=A0AAV9N6N6_9EURO|nr:hypothetical protein LTR84_003364 [Exophiala bonariae]